MPYTPRPDLLIRPQSHSFIGVPVPAEGSKVTLISGFPSSGGRELGEMESAPKLKRLGSMQEVKVVNSSTPIDFFLDGVGAELSIVVNRITAENWKLAMRGDIRMMADGSASIGIGNSTELTSNSILVSFESRAGSGEWLYIMLYDAIMTGEVEVELDPSKISAFQLTFTARAVAGRSTAFALGETNLTAKYVI